jgi:glycosyltransferase involved in cell wall biosynthesis
VRVLFATPAFGPATAFGGPIVMAHELTHGLAELGCDVDVVTTSLVDIRLGRTARTRRRVEGQLRISYLATPARYRWMGITPTLPLELERLPRPDVAHIFGFRDVVTTFTAAWCVARRVPFVFEPLGMFEPRVRKVAFKRVFDRTVARHVSERARAVIATSAWERDRIVAAGCDPHRVVIRGNGFPTPEYGERTGRLRDALGIGDDPLVLYLGRIAEGKGIEELAAAVANLPEAHLAVVGPDDGHGVADRLRALAVRRPRLHVHGPVDDALALYADADVFVLPSEGESFGMVAAEAAARGVPIVVSDRAGVAETLAGSAIVVPPTRAALQEAICSILESPERAAELRSAGLETAARNGWPAMVLRQLEIYREAVAS